MRRLILLLTVAALAMQAMGQAAEAGPSLGSAQGSSRGSIEQGGETVFRLYLFNTQQEEGVKVSLGTEKGSGLAVSISPAELELPYSEPGRALEPEPGFVFIGTPEGDVRARQVTVRVSAPLSAEEGVYEVVVYAATERGQGTVGASQTRRFRFTVEVGEGESQAMEQGVQAQSPKQEDADENETREGDDSDSSGKDEQEGLQGEEEGGSITGAATGIPVFGPLILMAAIGLLVALRLLKRI